MTAITYQPEDLTETATILARMLIDPAPAEVGGATETRRRLTLSARIVHSLGIGASPDDITNAVVETIAGFTDPAHRRDQVVNEIALRLAWLTDPQPDFAACPGCGGSVYGPRVDLIVSTVHCNACDARVNASIPLPPLPVVNQ